MNILEIIKDKKYLCNSDFSYYRNIDQIKNNKLYFCAYGGGFVKTISLENKNFFYLKKFSLDICQLLERPNIWIYFYTFVNLLKKML